MIVPNQLSCFCKLNVVKAIFLIVAEVNLRDCWTNKADTKSSCDGVNSLMLCMCADSDFCNCHSNPDLNGEKCPLPPSKAVDVTVIQFYLLLLSLLTTLTYK